MNLRREITGGITTFLTMAYIIVVNPSILATEATGLSFSGVLTATVILSFSMTLLMGLYAKIPFGVAPGMGLNAFLAYGVIIGQNVPWPIALGMVFWAGVLFLIASVTPVRVAIARAIPFQLRTGAAVGIGVFLSFIGLKNSGMIVGDPVTFVKFGGLNPSVVLSLFLLALSAILYWRKTPGAFLIAIGGGTLVAAFLGWIQWPDTLVQMPDFESTFFKLDIWGAFQFAFIPVIISVFFTDLFDSISTFVGVAQATGLTDQKGEAKSLKEGLIVDAFATTFAGLFGTSSGTAYIESASGIEAGGRTGVSAVVTALCFLPFMFFSPLIAIIPAYVTAPILILVGFLMFRTVRELRWERFEEALPAFLTVILIPLTFSITQGLLWGFIAHGVCYSATGRAREVSRMLWVIIVISLLLVTI